MTSLKTKPPFLVWHTLHSEDVFFLHTFSPCTRKHFVKMWYWVMYAFLNICTLFSDLKIVHEKRKVFIRVLVTHWLNGYTNIYYFYDLVVLFWYYLVGLNRWVAKLCKSNNLIFFATFLKVNFMLTNSLAARRRRSEDPNQGQSQHYSTRISNPLNQVYLDLALASGGLAIEVTKATLPQATSIIADASTSALVMKSISQNFHMV